MRNKQSPWLTLSVLLLMVVAGATFFAARLIGENRQADVKWEAYRAELAATGEPLTFAEIEALRPIVPDDENGALIIERLADTLEALGSNPPEGLPFFDEDMIRADPFRGISEASARTIRTFLKQNQPTIEELAKLRGATTGRMSTMSYDFEGDNPFDITLPSLSPWRNAGKICRLNTIQNLIDEDVEGAIDSIRMQFGIAATLRSEPNLIIRTIRLSIIRNALSSLEILMRTGGLLPQHFGEMEDLIHAQLASISPKNGLRGERVFLITLWENLANGRIELADVFGEMRLSRLKSVSHADIRSAQIAAAKFWTEQIEVADDPLEYLGVADRLERGITSSRAGGRRRAIGASLLPSVTVFANFTARHIAALKCAQTVLAAERFQIDNKRVPASITELVPDYLESMPIDPFNGEPLLFASTEYGIAIYSVGDNLTDEGGDFAIRKGRYHPPDTGFRLVELAKRGTISAEAAPSKSLP